RQYATGSSPGACGTAHLPVLRTPQTDVARIAARRGMEHHHRTRAVSDDGTVGERDPPVTILRQQTIARGPILLFVLAPVGMKAAGNVVWQPVGKALHGTPRGRPEHSY